MIVPAALPDLGAYRRYVVAFSGGKESLAALLHLFSLGVPPHAIELHHHYVDGRGPTFMDWPCKLGYVRAIAEYFGVALFVLWREGRCFYCRRSQLRASWERGYDAASPSTNPVGHML